LRRTFAVSANEPTASSPNLYETLGGAEPLRIAVDRFYDKVVHDPQLEHYFDGVDLARLKRHQVLLLKQVLGGPAEYSGRALSTAHADLAITGADYDRVVEHLVGTLTELNTDPAVVGAVEGVVASVRADIVADVHG
jgi:hemoglobin